ncbi:putative glucan endo-1,3-beta-glucosidase A6 [Glycine max]|nr:putative glucan endo-1,3-beta-glucosidase A6 [Glycine max]
MSPLAIFLVYLLLLSGSKVSSNIGVNYGQLGNNLPSPHRSIELLTAMKACDANLEILRLLSNTNSVSIIIPNNDISGIAANQSIADEWLRKNVLPYYPNTMIRYLLVGNEVLSYNSEQGHQMWRDHVPSMLRIERSLRAQNIRDIKVGTPLAMDVLQSTFPLSSGVFRSDGKFQQHKRPWQWLGLHQLVGPNDSLIFVMAKLGYPNINLVICKTGWPNSGDGEELGANASNAATYNRNLIQRMTTKPPIGTPARPRVTITTFIFSLFGENEKPGPGTERH